MGSSNSRCQQLCDQRFIAQLTTMIPGLKHVDFLTLPKYKNRFSYLVSKLSCDLFLLQNMYMKLNVIDEIESGHMLYKDMLFYSEYPSFIPIPKGSSYGINMTEMIESDNNCIFIKVTAPGGNKSEYCPNMVKTIEKTILPKNGDKITHVVLGWDADNYKDNDVFKGLIPSIVNMLEKHNIIYMYSNATFRDPSTQGQGWNTVLNEFTQRVDSILFVNPCKGGKLFPCDDQITKVPIGTFSKEYVDVMHNHNGWLGAQHVLYRHESLIKFPYIDKYVYINNSYVFLLNNAPSAVTENEFIAKYNNNPQIYPMNNAINIIHFSCN